ncbi:MAG: hypothetical protein OXC30_03960 [Alphaproteobacteria bacterium]|nr:hypothetical protein [Alphaproteobacteria bacterium]
MLKLLCVLLLSLNLPAAWKEAEVLWDKTGKAEVLWDKTGKRVCQVFEGNLRKAFSADAHQRDELFDAVDDAIKQGKDLGEVCSEFFSAEEMEPEGRTKAIDEAAQQGKDWYLTNLLLYRNFAGVKNYIEHQHLLSALNQYNGNCMQDLLSCIDRMKAKIKEDIHASEEPDKQQMSFTFKKNQKGHLCVRGFLSKSGNIGGQIFRLWEVCTVKVLESSFDSYIEHLPGYSFIRLTEQEESDFYACKSRLNLCLPEVGGRHDDVRLSIATHPLHSLDPKMK